ncbi:MAG: class I SAM-dependent methyltransferase [Chloroflexota bacterium]|nr:class I SAM-dependent methyltransferase [Chloroflexota bacterium]
MTNKGSEDGVGVSKEGVRQGWSERAAAWRKWRRQHEAQTRAATEAIVTAAGVGPGLRVLDLASGTGEPALTLAEAVGPGGQDTATDQAPEMLAVAEEEARARGLTNIAFRQGDAEALPFPDRSFDAVTCRFGIMFFPDPARALREVRRVLAPGGRAAFVAWGPLGRNPYFATTWGILAGRAGLPLEDVAPDMFKFAQRGGLAALLEGAGFGGVREEAMTVPWPWPGRAEEVWERNRDSETARKLIEQIPPERREEAVDEVLATLRQRDDGRQVSFTATIVVASGVR